MGLKIKKYKIIVFILSLIIFIPPLVWQYPIINGIVSIAYNLTIIGAIFLWICNRFRCSNFIKTIGIYFIIICISTFTNKGDILNTIISLTKNFALCYIIEYIILKYKYEGINTIKNTLAILVIINLITMIIMPNGIITITRIENDWYRYEVPWWLFGNKNGAFFWLYCLNLLAQLSLIYTTDKKHTWDYIFIIITIISSVISRSSTTMIAMILLSLFPLMKKILGKLKKIMNLRNYTIGYIILTIMLVTAIQFNGLTLITSLLGKDTTFTGRIEAWMNAKNLIFQKPIIGYGLLDYEISRKLFGGYAFVNAHNAILQILMQGGIIAFFVMVILYHCLNQKTKKIKNVNFQSFISWIMIALYIDMSFEASVDGIIFWITICLIYCISNLIETTKGVETNER